MDTVVRALHGVRHWKKFGEELFAWSGISDYDARLQAIEQQHRSDGNYLHGVVEEWFKSHQQSWRQIIYAMDWAKEIMVADRIRGYAEPPRGEWSDNCCVTRDLVIVSCPTTPISVEGLVSEPKCPSLNLKGNNPYSLMLPFELFMQHRLRPIQCSLHLLYVVQDSGGSKWSLSLGGCGLGKTLIWWLVIWYIGKFHWSNNTHNLTTPTNSKPLSLIATVPV